MTSAVFPGGPGTTAACNRVETVEGVGLWLDQLSAEYLTVIATSLLIPLELYELARKPSPPLGGARPGNRP